MDLKFKPCQHWCKRLYGRRGKCHTTSAADTVHDANCRTSSSSGPELSSADRHVAAVTARVQATGQDCAVCLLLIRLLTPCTVCVAIPSSDLLNCVRCPSSRSTLPLRHLNHIRLLTNSGA